MTRCLGTHYQIVKKQFMDSISEAVGCDFCECVHKEGKDLNECLREFENAKNQLEK